MSLRCEFLKGMLDGGFGTIGAVLLDAEFRSQFISRLEPDSLDVLGKLVRILLDLGNGFLTVSSIDPDGTTLSDAMLRHEQDDFPNFFLLRPTLGDPFELLGTDSLDAQ